MASANWLARRKRLWLDGLSAAAAHARHTLLARGRRLWALMPLVGLLLAIVFDSVIALMPRRFARASSRQPRRLRRWPCSCRASSSSPRLSRRSGGGRRGPEAKVARRYAQLAQLIRDMQALDELLGDPR